MKAERSVERSIDSLQRIYAVVVGLAINEGIKRFFLADNNQYAWPTANWPEFIAFMVTIIPFLHGMNRHLDRTLAEARRTGRRWLLIFLLLDFLFFIAESCFFVSMAAMVARNLYFFKILIILLLADAGWALMTTPVTRSASGRWMAINVMIAVAMAYIVNCIDWLTDNKCLALAALAILRTLLDYWFVWSFYFPQDDPAPVASPTAVVTCGFQEWMERTGRPEPAG